MTKYLTSFFCRDHILDLFVILATMVDEEQNKSWNVILLEIFYLLLRKETPEGLIEAYVTKTQNEKAKTSGNTSTQNGTATNSKPQSKLSALMAKEKNDIKARASANPVRHSKFNGVFVVTQVCFSFLRMLFLVLIYFIKVTGGQRVINSPIDLTSPQPKGISNKVLQERSVL